MSICKLTGLNLRICRQSYKLAFTRLQPPALQPVEGVSRLSLARSSSSNNSLYQMVKKRTLEARTKLQPAKYPNNQPCENPIGNNKPTNQSSSTIPISKQHPRQAKPCPIPQKVSNEPRPTSKPKSSKEDDVPGYCDPPKKTRICQNTEVLRTRGGGDDSGDGDGSGKGGGGKGGGGKGGDGKKGDSEKCDDKILGLEKNKFLALLALLGAGGLLFWLLSGRKKANQEATATAPTACNDQPAEEQRKNLLTYPPSSDMLPKHVPYLLIGGGTAAFSAFRAIKSNDPKAKVLMITNENRKPYMRPPLSKELWYSSKQGEITKDYSFRQWTGQERSLFFEPEEFFVDPTKLMDTVNGGIAVAHGFNVKKIDATKHIVTLNDGYEISYDECLIATGCSPKNLDVLNSAPSVKDKVMVYRTPSDFERLKQCVDDGKSITIVGSGFIGSELACSLANYAKGRGNKIYQIFPEEGNMSKVLPDYLSKWTMKKIEALGVCVLPKSTIKNAQRDESSLKLYLNNGSTILTDIAVVCVGCEANTQIAAASGLEIDRTLGGFVVNAELEARRNLFVAGDASCFFDPLLGRRRVEHHDHSVVSGRLAGENMVGKKKAYTHQSMFWSDLGPEVGYEGIGLVDASLPTVGVFALPSKVDRSSDNLTENREQSENPGGNLTKSSKDMPASKCEEDDGENYGRGVIFYLKDDKIVGILLWNLFNRIGLARTIINQNKKYDDLNEVAKLFEIHA